MLESAAVPIAPIELRYRPLIELGRGGTARVYLADSLVGLHKLVVLKTLAPELSMDAEMRDLFRREAEVCARLNHPNIVQVHEVIEQVTGPVIVMEYLEGVALSQVISQSAERFPKRLYVHAITQLLSGLHYFHELRDYDRTTALSPVHRDVSPQNVIILCEGAVKVLDFGIAKLANQEQRTQTGIIKGKLHYMPAEQLLSDLKLDRRADIFSAGVMLWEALAGHRMWQGCSENDTMKALIHGNFPNLRDAVANLPAHFYEIVAKATAYQAVDRYPTALDFQIDVERILTDLGGPVQPRELSDFMRKEFGAYRQEQEAAIEQAIRSSSTTKIVLGGHLDLSGDARQDTHSNSARRRNETNLAMSEVREPKVSKGHWIGYSVIGLVVMVLLGLLMKANRPPLASANTTQSNGAAADAALPESVAFSITSVPPGALVVLEGIPLGRTPWSGQVPAKKQVANLELRAESFQPITKVVSLAEDLNLAVYLSPLDSPPALPSASNAAKQSGSKPHLFRAPSRKGAPTSATSACNPPYTLSADGIRTYKVECLR